MSEAPDPSRFDPQFYRAHYAGDAAITAMSDDEAAAHYRAHGRAEGRFANAAALERSFAEFDADFYRAHYADDPAIAAMSVEEAVHHYRAHGMCEGRFASADAAIRAAEAGGETLPPDFDEQHYVDNHSDVREHMRFPRAGALHYLLHGRAEGRAYRKQPAQVFDRHYLDLVTNRVYDLPDVVVDADAPVRINVLVPAFDFKSMSAGFFGVFQVARFIKRCGFAVRLVMFDNFYWNEAEFRERLRGYPGMEALFDELEIDYIGARDHPLTVSPHDNCVATVWYSAWFADKIMARVGRRPFLYLIQDYETNFHPGSSSYALADASYDMNFNVLFSTRTLQEFFTRNRIGIFAGRVPEHTFFNNAAAANLGQREAFVAPGDRPHRFALYSRPVVSRNMFELAALALCQAYAEGVFAEGDWEFYGIGLGDAEITLAEDVALRQLPRMNLKDYQATIATFDIGLSLMASPHPSLLPFDLGGSGAVVVTNTFGPKQQAYFDAICGNVIARAPAVPDLVAGLREAVARVGDRQARYDHAARMRYPRTWEESFDADHKAFVGRVFRGSEPREVAAA